MMRTPVGNATSVARKTNTPAGIRSISTRRVLVRASSHQSSDQLAACLVNYPRSSVPSFSRSYHLNERKENVVPHIPGVLTERKKLMGNMNNNVTRKENVVPDIPEVLTERKKSMGNMNNNVTLVNQVGPSNDGEFYKHFVGWLMNTEKEIDTATSARLKADLCQLVGKYTLENQN